MNLNAYFSCYFENYELVDCRWWIMALDCILSAYQSLLCLCLTGCGLMNISLKLLFYANYYMGKSTHTHTHAHTHTHTRLFM